MIRRDFLRRSAAIIAATGAFLYPGIDGLGRYATAGSLRVEPGFRQRSPVAQDPSRPAIIHEVSGADPSFATGIVTDRTIDGVVLKSEVAMRAVRIAPDAIVWKEYTGSPELIEIGDWVDVKGTPQEDGSLQALSGWILVNIGRRDGTLESVTADGIVIRHRKGLETLELSPLLEVIDSKDGSRIEGGIQGLPQSAAIGAVGLRLPGGRLRATRIWL